MLDAPVYTMFPTGYSLSSDTNSTLEKMSYIDTCSFASESILTCILWTAPSCLSPAHPDRIRKAAKRALRKYLPQSPLYPPFNFIINIRFKSSLPCHSNPPVPRSAHDAVINSRNETMEIYLTIRHVLCICSLRQTYPVFSSAFPNKSHILSLLTGFPTNTGWPSLSKRKQWKRLSSGMHGLAFRKLPSKSMDYNIS